MTPRLRRRDKWLYGSGDLGFSLTNTILNVYFALYLTDVVGVTPAIAAMAFFIGRTWDYVNDPIVGYISERVGAAAARSCYLGHCRLRRPSPYFGGHPRSTTSLRSGFTTLWYSPCSTLPPLLCICRSIP